jgi:hypothetical protein
MDLLPPWIHPRFLADLVVVAHFLFVVFAVFGGLIGLRYRKIIWMHLPALLWAVVVEFTGWICPLTPLEQWIRTQGGVETYSGSFIEHYLVAILYPAGLTRSIQIFLGALLLGFNLLVYALVFRRWKEQRKSA